MDDNYLDEVLPRWKFWKEYLIEQLERYSERFEERGWFCELSDKEIEKIKEINAEMIEKTKGIKSRIGWGEITDELTRWRNDIKDVCNWRDCDYAGVFWEDIINEHKLSNWLALTDFCDMMNKKNEQTEE